jgi:hypothetical protein
MVDVETKQDYFNWKLPLYGALASALISVPIAILGNDIGGFLYCIFLVPPLCLAFLWVVLWSFAGRGRWLKTFALMTMLAAFWIVSVAIGLASNRIREDEQWLVHAQHFKREVVASHVKSAGELKHVEWNGWGFPGAGDTIVYRVFDPEDSLSGAARSHPPIKVSGIPCEVFSARRLEKQWYAVTFYTDGDWEHCAE